MSSTEFLDQAIIHLEEAVRLQPEKARYCVILGEAFLLRGEPDAALPPLMAAFQTVKAPRTAWLLGLTLLILDRFTEARECGAEAIRGSESFDKALEIRAWATFGTGQWSAAAEDFRSLVRKKEADTRSALGLAACIGFQHLEGRSEADPMQISHWLDSQERALLETRECRFLRSLADGRLTQPTAKTMEMQRMRFVRAATRGLLHDLPGRVSRVTAFHLSSRGTESW